MTLLERTPSPSVTPEIASNAVQTEREHWLQSLLGTDYEHAQSLIGQFAYNPQIGQDALKHILSGETIMGSNDMSIAFGFHHEPSAGKNTWVHRDTDDTEHAPFSPYQAYVFIDGKPKVKPVINDEGEAILVPQRSSMFPKEYDALAVMKTIVGARDSRDTSTDKQVEKFGRKLVEARGKWHMMDNQTMMRLKLELDPVTNQILVASPETQRADMRRYAAFLLPIVDKKFYETPSGPLSGRPQQL